MRSFNGTSATLSTATSFLSGAADPFAIWFWYSPTVQDVGGTARTLMRSGDGSDGWWVEHINANVVFRAVGYTGTDPVVTIPWPDAGRPHFVGFRKSGAGASAWHAWLDDVIGTISGAINFTLGSPATQRFDIGSNAGGSSWALGELGEVAIWGVRPTNEMMVEGAEGVAADQFPAGLLGYWPCRGNTSPEPDYSGKGHPLTVTAAAAAPHIEVVPSIYPAASKTAFAPAWVVDIENPLGGDPLRQATRDLFDDRDMDALGVPYKSGVEGDPQITVALPSNTGNPGGIIEPENWSVVIQNGDQRFDRSLEWRQRRIRMRLYDRVSHALFTPASGLITDRDFEVDGVSFQCSAIDPALDMVVPKQLIELNSSIEKGSDPGEKPIDVGVPIPVACGDGGYCAPPYIEHDLGDGTHPGGQRYLLSWGTGVGVKRAFFDADPNSPGLEQASFFSEVTGATWRAANKFRVAAEAAAERFQEGWLISYSPDGGTTFLFSRVLSTAVGTGTADVTLGDSILGALSLGDPLSDLYVADDFEIEDGVWEFDNGTVVTDMTTALDPAEGSVTPIFELTTPLRANPAEFAAFWMSDPDLGANLVINTVSLTQAEADFADAELDDAIAHVVAGDRQPASLRSLVNQAGSMRGMRVWKDYEADEYLFDVDKLPRLTNLLRLGIGTNLNNLLGLPKESPTSLFQAVSVLKTRYGAGGRVINAGSFSSIDYAYANTANAQPVGKLSVVELRLVRSHEKAARIAYYWAKTLEHSDGRIAMVAGRDAWRVKPGKLVQAVVDAWGLDAPYRALSVTYALDQFQLALAGPFDAEIFETDIGVINSVVQQPTGSSSPDERPTETSGGNLLPNPDFSNEQHRAAPANHVSPAYDSGFIPGWTLHGSGTNYFSAASVDRETLSVGGYVLSLTTTASVGAGPYYPLSPIIETPPTVSDAAAFTYMPVRAGQIYVPSIYLSADTAVPIEYSFRFQIQWLNGIYAGDINDNIAPKIVPGANPHPQGWRRYYALVRAPANATGALMSVCLILPSTTYYLDAVQFEALARVNRLPALWQRSMSYGLHPSQQRAGDVTVRAPGEIEMGLQIAHDIANDGSPVTLSGATTDLVTVLPGDVHFVNGYVSADITGCSGWKLTLDGEDIYTGMGLATGSNISGSHRNFSPPYPVLSAKTLRAEAIGGTFTGGAVRVAVQRFTGVSPTA